MFFFHDKLGKDAWREEASLPTLQRTFPITYPAAQNEFECLHSSQPESFALLPFWQMDSVGLPLTSTAVPHQCYERYVIGAMFHIVIIP